MRVRAPSRISAIVLFHQDRKRAEPGDPVFVVLDRLKPQPISQLIRGLDAAALIDRHQVDPEFEALDIGLEILLEEVVVELVRGRELARGRFCSAGPARPWRVPRACESPRGFGPASDRSSAGRRARRPASDFAPSRNSIPPQRRHGASWPHRRWVSFGLRPAEGVGGLPELQQRGRIWFAWNFQVGLHVATATALSRTAEGEGQIQNTLSIQNSSEASQCHQCLPESKSAPRRQEA